jgi:hypothetical protein
MENTNPNAGQNDSSALVTVLVLVVIAIAVWIGYTQGVFSRKATTNNNPSVSINVNLPVTSSAPSGNTGY